jgi:hypothetical protein
VTRPYFTWIVSLEEGTAVSQCEGESRRLPLVDLLLTDRVSLDEILGSLEVLVRQLELGRTQGDLGLRKVVLSLIRTRIQLEQQVACLYLGTFLILTM